MKIDNPRLSVKVRGESSFRSYEIFKCDQLERYANVDKAYGDQIEKCFGPKKAEG